MTYSTGSRVLSLFFGDPPIPSGLSYINLIDNPGFETAGTGTVTPTGTDVFDGWIEFDAGYELEDEDPPDDGDEWISSSFAGFLTGIVEDVETSVNTAYPVYAEGVVPKSVIITRDSLNEHSGSFCCQMYSNRGGNVSGNVWQWVTVEPGTLYRLSLWSKTENGVSIEQGRLRVYDATNERDIIPLQNIGIVSDEWEQTSFYFSTGWNTRRIAVLLYQNIHAGSSVFFDDVALHARNRRHTTRTYELVGPPQYTHTITAAGGFDTMTSTFPVALPHVNLWMEDMLFRQVVVHDGVQTVWEGFVDQVALSLADIQFAIGPVKSISNRGKIVFREMSYATTPPTGGATIATHFVDIEESIDQYGIMEAVITGGSGSYEEMMELLNTIMDQLSKPDISQGVSFGGGGEVNVTITCAGYHYLLDKYIYNNTGEAGMISATEKITRALTKDPNGLFSSNRFTIENNDLEVKSYENEDKTARTIITDVVALGDANDRRYHWGVYEDRSFVYEAVTGVEPKYKQSMLDGGLISDASDAVVHPWLVRPGHWMTIGDLLTGKPVNTSRFRDDPRLLFIESISYTSPNSVTITAGKATTFRQQLDRLGLGGIQ